MLPTIPGSRGVSAIIRVAGITTASGAYSFKRVDGVNVRPSLVLIDDPQTGRVARRRRQCANRERILPARSWAWPAPEDRRAHDADGVRPTTWPTAFSTATSTRSGRASGRRWYSFPKNGPKSWAEYARCGPRASADRGGRRRPAFLQRGTAAMDAGAVIAWSSAFNHDELSAVQHAMNLRLQNEAAFFAEYQNEPLPEVEVADDLLSADQIAAKVNGHARGLVPSVART